ncbi:hypothetical protein VTO42DRAFT_4748 [Malbranchea cinnamomea]
MEQAVAGYESEPPSSTKKEGSKAREKFWADTVSDAFDWPARCLMRSAPTDQEKAKDLGRGLPLSRSHGRSIKGAHRPPVCAAFTICIGLGTVWDLAILLLRLLFRPLSPPYFSPTPPHPSTPDIIVFLPEGRGPGDRSAEPPSLRIATSCGKASRASGRSNLALAVATSRRH